MIPLTLPAPDVTTVTPDELEAIADAAGVGVTVVAGQYYAVTVDRGVAKVYAAAVPDGEASCSAS